MTSGSSWPEPLEERDREVAETLLLVGTCVRHRLDEELERTLRVARVERREDVGQLTRRP